MSTNFKSPGVELALSVTPEYGMILVFGDSGTDNPNGYVPLVATRDRKKIKIFWIFTPCCWGYCGQDGGNGGSMRIYKILSENKIFDMMSELNINQFFTDAVHTVGFRI